MTYEEAKADIWREHCCICDHGGCESCKYNIAIKALEKQIPKKPKKADGDNLDWNCPRCGKFVGWVDALAWEKEHHCTCGQAIDWGDE